MGKEMVKCLSVAAAPFAGVASASTVGTSILLGTADARCEIICSSQGGGERVAACGTKNAIAYFVPLSGCRFGSICGIIHAH